MNTQIQAKIPEQLLAQAQRMVQQGWAVNMDAFIKESMQRYIESHQSTTTENFIRDDIDWGLHGED
ncbi:MAG: CopG family transcriptional regulator [Methyloprofundus sp.]|nr:CopG family transcriptional regulator [Methyloprofundus sp.]